ncbi:MAG: SWIM zinc finger family protein, partial [Myxococcales bacterium]
MEFTYAYPAASSVESRGDQTRMSFAPDVSRPLTYFSGELGQGVAFREAISALHDVVISDLRYTPRDKSDYKTWAAADEEAEVQRIAAQRDELRLRVDRLQGAIREIEQRSRLRNAPFDQAKQRYFNYLYTRDFDAWVVLDPVITVHPDEVSFECFSQDESTYGRLAAGYGVFKQVGEHACGTTNIDYSSALYTEFQKIRSYKSTRLEVDPGGLDVKTENEADYRQVKIDLPDSWVRGFLQVSSAMTLPAVSVSLHPMDVHSICQVLRRHREKSGPRSLRYHLTPGQPVRLVFEPWGIEVICRRSIFEGSQPHVIRTWGRRRLLVLERLLPVAQRFVVHLLGTGLPSFYVADLGEMSFTLGLSGWTSNDWSRAGHFDLLAPRFEVDQFTAERVFSALKKRWLATADELSAELSLPRPAVLGALGAYVQAGRAVFD